MTMQIKKITNCWTLVLISLMIISCSESKNTRYKDISHLEKPPTMPTVKKQAKAGAEDEEKDEDVTEEKGLRDDVILAEIEQKPIIKIKKDFDQSWDIVEQALELDEIEISDKNRNEGVFYVIFDPDTKSDSTLADAMTFFLFKDDYREAAYKLTISQKQRESVISIHPIDSDEIDLLDDDGDDFDGTVDEGVILINTLYKTIRDDLPLN